MVGSMGIFFYERYEIDGQIFLLDIVEVSSINLLIPSPKPRGKNPVKDLKDETL